MPWASPTPGTPTSTTPQRQATGPKQLAELGVPADRIFKTLLVEAGDGLAVAIVPVAGQLDLKSTAAALAVKAAYAAIGRA